MFSNKVPRPKVNAPYSTVSLTARPAPENIPPFFGVIVCGGGACSLGCEVVGCAGDTLGFLGSLPGDIVGGFKDAYETSKFITYLVTAGVLVGGGVYLYRMRTD